MFKKQHIIYFIFAIILTLEFITFKDYLNPLPWGKIKVSGMSCTCPDEKVLNGETYLKYITPDSLKQYHIDYSEIYVTKFPKHLEYHDPMGSGMYWITGEVIGKARVSKSDRWNVIVNVDKWTPVDLMTNFIAKILFSFTLLALVYNSSLGKALINRIDE